jgi:hypothetical protein
MNIYTVDIEGCPRLGVPRGSDGGQLVLPRQASPSEEIVHCICLVAGMVEDLAVDTARKQLRSACTGLGTVDGEGA